MPLDFSDSEIFEFASRVLNVLDLQAEYFASKDRTLLGECRFQETELRKLAQGIVAEIRNGRRKDSKQYTQPALFDNSPATLPG